MAAIISIASGALANGHGNRRERTPVERSPLPMGVENKFVVQCLRLSPFSVLGTRLTADGRLVAEGRQPFDNIMFTDPAGIPYIHGAGPSGAGGASGAIYTFLGISQEDEFPADVREHVKSPTDAWWHTYSKPMGDDAVDLHCCHCVGPNFMEIYYDAAEDVLESPEEIAKAIDQLSTCYSNVIAELARSPLRHLRLLPISGGIFSGPFAPVMPTLTAKALGQAISQLDGQVAAALSSREGLDIEMCIFEEVQYDAFRQALNKELGIETPSAGPPAAASAAAPEATPEP